MHPNHTARVTRLRRLAASLPRPSSGVPGITLAAAAFMAIFLNTAFWKAVILDKTLITVTADHGHVFKLTGYPTRGKPILGKVVGNDASGTSTGEPELAADGLPYTRKRLCPWVQRPTREPTWASTPSAPARNCWAARSNRT